MNPIEESAIISKLSARISEGIEFLTSIYYVKRDVEPEMTTLTWRGIAGISESLQSLTSEEEVLQRKGYLVWTNGIHNLKNRMERYGKNCESLEEAIKKEEIYVSSFYFVLLVRN